MSLFILDGNAAADTATKVATKAAEAATNANTAPETYIWIAVVCLVLGYLASYLVRPKNKTEETVEAKKDERMSIEEQQVLVQQKAELETQVAQSQEKVDTALNNLQNLAANMATTYHSLYVAKAALDGREVGDERYALQIKDGKLEQITLVDAEPEAEEVVAEETVAEEVVAEPEVAQAAEEVVVTEEAVAAEEAPAAEEAASEEVKTEEKAKKVEDDEYL